MERRLIDANAIHGECNSDNPEFIAGWNALAVEIDQAPTIDAVEVVRCKDCTNHDSCTFEDTFKLVGLTDGFCRVGKRREPDEE